MSGIDTRRRVAAANRWRDQYNPLRSLTIPRAVSMFEAALRGEYADLQWTYRFVEQSDADLIALIERRGNALLAMDWNVKQVDEKVAAARGIPFDATLAERQAAELRAAYERIENLYEAIEHLALAAFREYALCQLQEGDKAAKPGKADRLECLHPWNIVRDGLEGDWWWNPEARQAGVSGLGPAGQKIDPAFCLIREWPRPLNRLALLKFIRSNLSQKDWDGFIEIYGIPGVLVKMPENIPHGKETEYKTAAEDVAEGKSGALPAGADAVVMDQPRGVNPFRDHLQYLTEKLVMAGTGGLLTMLTAPGSGTLAGSAHMEAFEIVARGEARKIGEIFQRQFDRPILEAAFPDKPRLAYFELAANEEQDVGEILDHAVKIATAGGQVDWAEISEKTGYTIRAAPPPPPPPPAFAARGEPLINRAAAAEPSDQPFVARALSEHQAESARQFDSWLAALSDYAAQPGVSDADFAAEARRRIEALPHDLLTPENIARLAEIGESPMGQAVVDVLLHNRAGASAPSAAAVAAAITDLPQPDSTIKSRVYVTILEPAKEGGDVRVYCRYWEFGRERKVTEKQNFNVWDSVSLRELVDWLREAAKTAHIQVSMERKVGGTQP